MFVQRSMTLRPFLAAALVFTLAGSTAPLAFAGIALNTIDPVALVTDNGRHIIVTGPIACAAGEQALVTT